MSTSAHLVQSFSAFGPSYDRSVEPLQPLKDTLHALIGAHFGDLPPHARILVAGAGTGAEVRALAPRAPGWRFTLVDPAEGMLEVARGHAIAGGFADRCTFHTGFVSSLQAEPFDAALSVLVSHFLTDAAARQAYFADIAQRLAPGGRFFNADLCADVAAPTFPGLMALWPRFAGVPPEREAPFREAFGRDFAVHGPAEVEAMLVGAGFPRPVPCLVASVVRGWAAVRG